MAPVQPAEATPAEPKPAAEPKPVVEAKPAPEPKPDKAKPVPEPKPAKSQRSNPVAAAEPSGQRPAPVHKPVAPPVPRVPVGGAVATVTELTKVFGTAEGQVDALRGVDLTIGQGRWTAIMGRSGSGKTALLQCMSGLEAPTSGSVEVGGQVVSAMTQRQRSEFRRQAVGLVFQSCNLLPALTAAENIRLPLFIAKATEDPDWFDQIVTAFDLSETLTRKPSELSNGQQQRVACARALILKPSIVFADEPTGSLENESESQLLSMLRQCVDRFGQTVVVATHDVDVAVQADVVYVLQDGLVTQQVTTPSADRLMGLLRAVPGGGSL